MGPEGGRGQGRIVSRDGDCFALLGQKDLIASRRMLAILSTRIRRRKGSRGDQKGDLYFHGRRWSSRKLSWTGRLLTVSR